MSDEIFDRQVNASNSESSLDVSISSGTRKRRQLVDRFQEKFLTWKQKHRDEDRLKYYIKNSHTFTRPSLTSNLNNTQANMAHLAQPLFDDRDPELNGLSQAQIAYLNRKAREQADTLLANANPAGAEAQVQLPQNRIVNLNTRVDPPTYNPDTQTSATYFNKCEKYFRSQNIPENQFHNMAHVIMKGNMKLWYDSVVDTINSWDEFKVVFQSRFDSAATKERRMRLLLNRKQQIYEPCEQFIQEMVTLAKQVNPLESEHKSVERAYSALVSDIKRYAGHLSNLTVNSLLEILPTVYETIREDDRRYNRNTRLPPLMGFREQRENKVQTQFTGDLGNANRYFRPRFQPQSSFVRQSNTTYQPRALLPPQNNTQFGFNSQLSRPSTSTLNPTAAISSTTNNFGQQNSTFTPRGRNNFTTTTTTTQQRPIDKSNLRCRKCNNLGHFANECRIQQQSISMAIPAFPPHNSEIGTQSLNYQGETSQSYEREYSQFSNTHR